MCILTAEVVGLIFYNTYIAFNSIGFTCWCFTVVAFEAHRKMKKGQVQQKRLVRVGLGAVKGIEIIRMAHWLTSLEQQTCVPNIKDKNLDESCHYLGINIRK